MDYTQGQSCIAFSAGAPSCESTWAEQLGTAYTIAVILRIPLCVPAVLAHIVNTRRMILYEGWMEYSVRKVFNTLFFVSGALTLPMMIDLFNYRNTGWNIDSICAAAKASVSSTAGWVMILEGITILSEICPKSHWMVVKYRGIRIFTYVNIVIVWLWNLLVVILGFIVEHWYVSRPYYLLYHGGVMSQTALMVAGCSTIVYTACSILAADGNPSMYYAPMYALSDDFAGSSSHHGSSSETVPKKAQPNLIPLPGPPSDQCLGSSYMIRNQPNARNGNWFLWWLFLIRPRPRSQANVVDRMKGANRVLRTAEAPWVRSLVRLSTACGLASMTYIGVYGVHLLVRWTYGPYLTVTPTKAWLWMEFCLRMTDPSVSTLSLMYGYPKVVGGTIVGSDFVVQTPLGEGHYGVVMKGLLRKNKRTIPVAIKVVKEGLLNSEAESELLREARLMMAVSHWNVLRCEGLSYAQGTLHMLVEFMELGDLQHFVAAAARRGQVLGLAQRLWYGLQIAQGMQAVARQGIVHRDLAARNCMITSASLAAIPDGAGKKGADSPSIEQEFGMHTVKVSDFGMARRVEGGPGGVYRESSAPRIPIRWTAPECVDGHVYSERSDVWAWAVTAWELFADGSPPFQDIPTRNVHAAVKAGCRPERPATCPPLVYDLLLKCWALEPNDRPVFSDIIDEVVRLFGQVCEGVKTAFPGNSQDQSHAELQRQATNESGRSVASGFPQVFVSQCDNYITDPSQIYIEAIEADGVMVGGMADKVLKVRKKSEKSSHDESYIDLKGEDMLEFRSTSEDC